MKAPISRRQFFETSTLAFAGATVSFSTSQAAPGNARPRRFHPPFFALCMDTHDAKKRTLAEQATLLKELGYAGAGHLWLDQLDERLKTLDAAGLTLFQVYIRATLEAGKPAFDARLKGVLPLLKGRDTMLAVIISGAKPSDTALDDRVARIVRDMADLAQTANLRVALYPHRGDWLERVGDGLRIAKKLNRPDVGVMFNLCHWLAVDDETRLAPLLRSAGPRLFAVSLHGADRAAEIQAGKGNWIQPLGNGSFDNLALLRVLRDIGYRGPVGLQCYGLPGDAREHLTQSIGAWRDLVRKVNASEA